MPRRQTDRTGRRKDSARILIVDDDGGIRAVLAEVLSHLGYQVEEAPDGFFVSRALHAGAFSFDLVVLDWKMPGLDGLAVLQQLRTSAPETLVILISSAADDQLRREALSLGAFGVLRKPMHLETLVSLVETALQQRAGGRTSDWRTKLQ
jgi:two-component system response regulator (stage 0 sporulation protein F)